MEAYSGSKCIAQLCSFVPMELYGSGQSHAPAALHTEIKQGKYLEEAAAWTPQRGSVRSGEQEKKYRPYGECNPGPLQDVAKTLTDFAIPARVCLCVCGVWCVCVCSVCVVCVCGVRVWCACVCGVCVCV